MIGSVDLTLEWVSGLNSRAHDRARQRVPDHPASLASADREGSGSERQYYATGQGNPADHPKPDTERLCPFFVNHPDHMSCQKRYIAAHKKMVRCRICSRRK